MERRRLQLRRRERFGRGVANLFEIPEDLVLNVPRLTIIGNLQMIIENHRGLVEYSPTLIRVATANGQITVVGQELAVGSVYAEDLSVMGRFSQVTFEETSPEELVDRELARGEERARTTGGRGPGPRRPGRRTP